MNFLKPTGKRIVTPLGCVCSDYDAHAGARNGGGNKPLPCNSCGCSCGTDKVRKGNRTSAASSDTTW